MLIETTNCANTTTEKKEILDPIEEAWQALQGSSRETLVEHGFEYTPGQSRRCEEAFRHKKTGRRFFRQVSFAAPPSERSWKFDTAPHIILKQQGFTFLRVRGREEVFRDKDGNERVRPIPESSARVHRVLTMRQQSQAAALRPGRRF